MSRLSSIFSTARSVGKKALMPYVTAGDPNIEFTETLLHKLVEQGADIIEVGVPFSDPMADGPTVQLACERALASGTRLPDVLDMVRRFRERDQQTGIVIMGYFNPVEAMGHDRFLDRVAECGADGVLIVDMPPEEAEEFAPKAVERGLDPIFLVAPTTEAVRLPQFQRLGRGFLYYVSLKGVTGASHLNVDEVASKVAEIRQHASLPVAVGFGISTPEHAASVARVADGVVVGSALVKLIEGSVSDLGEAERATCGLLKSMRDAMDNATMS